MFRRRRFRRNSNSNRFRRRRFRTRSTVRRRIIRRGLARRPLRPEVKWIDKYNNLDARGDFVDPGTLGFWVVSANIIDPGTAINQRIGNKVKFRKLLLTVRIENAFKATADTYYTRVRVLLLVPRVDGTNFVQYMSTLSGRGGFVDTNMATIMMDREYNLNNLITLQGSVNSYAGSGERGVIEWTKSIAFPRTVEFRTGTSQIQDSKDALYLYVFNNNTVLSGAGNYVSYRCRTTYVDA